ncbi:MAG TPA: acyl-CoA dehydratase activase [bacterium]|mgnify:CR=1 FL=1|nr:acyl-CoA dehydratase activase [bacterium]
MITLGVDLGSNTVKTVIIEDGKKFLAGTVKKTSHDAQRVLDECLGETLDKAGVSRDSIEKTVATGYGRVSCKMADKEISEISCHGKGAYWSLPGVRTIIDIGGQDSKVISLNDQGKIMDFAMNDKCAAGTGRFLEVMAQALQVPLDDFGDISLTASRSIDISNTCTVFAESEVISLLARQEPKENIIAGIHQSIAKRVTALAKRLRIEDDLALTGGVALNMGVKRALEAASGKVIKVPENPQLIGALGAAVHAFEIAN